MPSSRPAARKFVADEDPGDEQPDRAVERRSSKGGSKSRPRKALKARGVATRASASPHPSPVAFQDERAFSGNSTTSAR